jgi:hypothetical protein
VYDDTTDVVTRLFYIPEKEENSEEGNEIVDT